MKKDISMPVIKRLPRYYRFLSKLDNENVDRISSSKLAEIMNSTASQVRQDLNCFGGFGHQGIGYKVSTLKDEIGKILGLNSSYKAILLGAGNLGRAVATHMNFNSLGFDLCGIFDKDEKIIGSMLRGLEVSSDDKIEEFCKDKNIEVAFLCLPESSVKNQIDLLYSLGIKCYWNFSHYDISMRYKDTIVENVHMSDSLMTLCYRITESNIDSEF